MRITSYFTYLLPGIVLFLTSSLLVNPFFDVFSSYFALFRIESVEKQLLIFSLLLIGVGVLFIYCISKFVLIYVKTNTMLYAASAAIAAVVLTVNILVENDSFDFSLIGGTVFFGSFIYWSVLLLRNRNMAYLTTSSIQYKNLLGEEGEISLNAITMIDQKRNMLSIFRELKFLDWIKRTSITYQDENFDEFELIIYPMIMQGENFTFNKIVDEARKTGNAKIRQYVS